MKELPFSPRRLAFIVVGLCTGLAISFAQTAFERTYGSGGNDEAYSVRQTTDGGYIIVGSADPSGTGNLDVYMVKTNPSGDTLWTRTYGGPREERGFAVLQTSDGGYVVAGYASLGGPCHMYIIKTTSSGDTLWTKQYAYSDISYEIARSIQQTSDGGYIIAGYTYPVGLFRGATADAYLIKTNSSGDTLWTRTYGDSGEERVYAVRQTPDGGYILAGYASPPSFSPCHFYVVKTTSSGDTLWTRETPRGSSGQEIARSLSLTSDDGYIIAGFTSIYGSSSSEDVYLVRMTSSGDTAWTRTYGDSGHAEYGLAVQVTSDGGYVVAGSRWSGTTDEPGVYVIKTNSSGDTLWTRAYGGAKEEEALSLQQTSDGGYIIAGYTDSFGAGKYDMYLIKTRPDGLVAVENNRDAMPVGFGLQQNYPNPFNPLTIIKYTIAGAGGQDPGVSKTMLVVYDVLGREVATLVNEDQAPGSYAVNFDGSGLSSGVYFYRLTAGGFVQSRRMVLLK